MSASTPLSASAKPRIGLVIVDLQNDFLSPEGAYARGHTVSPEALLLPARVAPVAQAVKQHKAWSPPVCLPCGQTHRGNP